MLRTLLPVIAFLGIAPWAFAQTQVLYVGSFGGSSSATTLSQVGWTAALGSETSGYDGIYTQAGALDENTSQSLPEDTVYLGGASGSGAIYTTDSSGAGTNGTQAFSDINPLLYSSVAFSVEAQQSYLSSNASNYFAIQVAGSWYLSTTPMVLTTGSASAAGEYFSSEALTYNPAAANWDSFTVSGSSITLGAVAGSALSGDITGVGIVQTLSSPGGSWDFNNFEVTATSAVPEPDSLALVASGASIGLFALRRRRWPSI
jgi:hypothetical protein